jgi:exodeoxyribonuclease V alpha subunit
LFYTAITRARELFIIVGNADCITAMVSNKQRLKRYGGLKNRLIAVSEGREVC